jgi:hypothetical protein
MRSEFSGNHKLLFESCHIDVWGIKVKLMSSVEQGPRTPAYCLFYCNRKVMPNLLGFGNEFGFNLSTLRNMGSLDDQRYERPRYQQNGTSNEQKDKCILMEKKSLQIRKTLICNPSGTSHVRTKNLKQF